jgi:hypothetical protein
MLARRGVEEIDVRARSGRPQPLELFEGSGIAEDEIARLLGLWRLGQRWAVQQRQLPRVRPSLDVHEVGAQPAVHEARFFEADAQSDRLGGEVLLTRIGAVEHLEPALGRLQDQRRAIQGGGAGVVIEVRDLSARLGGTRCRVSEVVLARGSDAQLDAEPGGDRKVVAVAVRVVAGGGPGLLPDAHQLRRDVTGGLRSAGSGIGTALAWLVSACPLLGPRLA